MPSRAPLPSSRRLSKTALLDSIADATQAEYVLHVALSVLCPSLSKLAGTIGSEAAFALMMNLGGVRVRIPHVHEVVRAMDMVNAVVLVSKGVPVEKAARKFGVSIAKLGQLVKIVTPVLDQLSHARRRRSTRSS